MTQIKEIKQAIAAITGNSPTAEAMRSYMGNPSLDARSIKFWEDALVSVQGYFARETKVSEPRGLFIGETTPAPELIPIKGLDKTLDRADLVAVLQEYFAEIAPGYPVNPVIHEVIAHNNRLEIVWGFTQKPFHSVNVSYQVVEEVTNKVLMEDQIVVPEIEVGNVVEFKNNTVLIENLTRIERRYVKTNVLKFVHFDYHEYLKLEAIQVDAVVKIKEVLYRVIQRDGDKLIVENGGGINCTAYVGEVEFVHKNYKDYALLPIISEASHEYEKRLTVLAHEMCCVADRLAILLKTYEEMTHNIPKSADVVVFWYGPDGELVSEQLAEAINSFGITLSEYQKVEREV